jgi:diguanylate cyclase (GGDEF)-like protein
VAGPTARTSRDSEPQDRRIRRTWWALSLSFLALAILAAARLVVDRGQPVDWLIAGFVTLGGFAAVLHREAVRGREMGRRGEAESVARILQGLSRSVSPDAIVEAIVDELDVETGADHTVVVRLDPVARVLEATLVSRRPGVPSSTTILPVTDLESPGGALRIDAGRRDSHDRAPVAVPIVAQDVAAVASAVASTREARAWAVAPATAGLVPPRPGPRSQGSPAGRRASDLRSSDRRGSDRRGSDRRGSERAGGRRRSWPALDAIASIRAFVAGHEGADATAIALGRGPAGLIADRLAERVSQTYGLAHTLAAPLITEAGVVGAIVLSRRTAEPWPRVASRILAGAAIEASAALERAYSHRAAEARAATDALTGLPNRRYFDEFCGLLARRRRADDALGVLMIDIDHFKRVNDRFGHATGDQVLRAVAEAVAGAVRDDDVPARFGGEEFAVLLRDPTMPGALEIAERVRAAVGALDLHRLGVGAVSVSVGVAVSHIADEPIAQIIEAADQALYAAKSAGRDRVVAA